MVMLAVLGYAFFGSPVEMYRRGELRRSMAVVEDGDVTLNEIVPFACDTVYTFEPYASRKEMERVMGISAKGLEESVSEDMVQLAFVKGNRVVCGVCGRISREKYGVSFGGKVNFADGTVFRAERGTNGILWLTEKNN